MSAERTVDALAQAVARLEERVARLEEAVVPVSAGAPAPLRASPTPLPQGGGAIDVALIGRSLIAVGGGYLLRALTDLDLVPDAAGILVGLGYSLALLLLADRAVARLAPASAGLHAATAVLVAYPLLSEAVVRYHVLGPWGAAAVATAFWALALVRAHRRRSPMLAWIFTIATSVGAVVTAIALRSLLPYVWLLTVQAAGTMVLARAQARRFLLWPVAAGGLFLVALLLVLALAGRGFHRPEWVLVSVLPFFVVFAGGSLLRAVIDEAETSWSEMLQTALALLVAAGLGAPVALMAGAQLPFALVLLGASLAGMTATHVALVAPGRTHTYWSSLWATAILLALAVGATEPTQTWLTLGMALALLAVAWRAGWSIVHLHVALTLAVAVVSSGLLVHAATAFGLLAAGVFAPPAAAVVTLGVVAVVGIVAIPERATLQHVAKVLLLGLMALGGGGVLAWLCLALVEPPAPVAAAIRTTILAATAILLGVAGRRFASRSAAVLVYPMLFVAGVKFFTEDIRVGNAGSVFVSLALLGLALIVAPRARRVTSR